MFSLFHVKQWHANLFQKSSPCKTHSLSSLRFLVNNYNFNDMYNTDDILILLDMPTG